MQISLELSYYPLHEEFKPKIRKLVQQLNLSSISCCTNTMSTQLFGDYHEVMKLITNELFEALNQSEQGVITMKIVKGNLDPQLVK